MSSYSTIFFGSFTINFGAAILSIREAFSLYVSLITLKSDIEFISGRYKDDLPVIPLAILLTKVDYLVFDSFSPENEEKIDIILLNYEKNKQTINNFIQNFENFLHLHNVDTVFLSKTIATFSTLLQKEGLNPFYFRTLALNFVNPRELIKTFCNFGFNHGKTLIWVVFIEQKKNKNP